MALRLQPKIGEVEWVPSERVVDGTQKAKSELRWDNLPIGRSMNEDLQRLWWANEDAKTTISSALRTVEETRQLLDLVQAMSSPLITTEPPLRTRPNPTADAPISLI